MRERLHSNWRRWRIPGLLGLIVLGHVALWMSDRVETDQKLWLTVMNAAIWAVFLLPAYGVARWAEHHRSKDDTPDS